MRVESDTKQSIKIDLQIGNIRYIGQYDGRPARSAGRGWTVAELSGVVLSGLHITADKIRYGVLALLRGDIRVGD